MKRQRAMRTAAATVALGLAAIVSPVASQASAPAPAWSSQGLVMPAGDVNGDGYSDILVGDPSYDDGARTNVGRASLYLGSATGPGAAPAWTVLGSQSDDALGSRVSTAGDVNSDGFADLLVLVWGTGPVVHVELFLGSPSGPAQTPASDLTLDRPTSGSLTVTSVGDIDGDGRDDVIIGDPSHSQSASWEGALFVYLGTSSGLAPTPASTLEGDVPYASFGLVLSGAGDVNADGHADVVLYAYRSDYLSPRRILVYLGSSNGLSASPVWSTDIQRGDFAEGAAVAGVGDVNGDGYADIAIGKGDFYDGTGAGGRVVVYGGSASGPVSTPLWTAFGGTVGMRFGSATAAAGDVNGDGYADVLVGAWQYSNGEEHEGRLYVFSGTRSGPQATAAIVVEGNQPYLGLGSSASPAGDVNGDGFTDFLVGTTQIGAPPYDGGYTHLFYGVGGAPPSTMPAVLTSVEGGYDAVSAAGDVDGDGYDDVLVGSTSDAGGAGSVRVYRGSASGMTITPAWTIDGEAPDAGFGSATAFARDVNGDGYTDVLVGAPSYGNGQAYEGRAYLYLGSATGVLSNPVWTAESNIAGARFGCSVGSPGDVNGDGYSDLLIGACYYTQGQFSEGRAYVYLGSAAGPGSQPVWTFEGDHENARIGSTSRTVGDVNGDGYSDVLVVTHHDSFDQRAFVFLGSASGPLSTPCWTFSPGAQTYFDYFDADGAGDVNGDGYADIVVGGDTYFENGQPGEGAAFVFAGSASGPGASPTWVLEGNVPYARVGYPVAGVGDVNGDGLSDVLLGSRSFNGGNFLFLGSLEGPGPGPAWSTSSWYAGTRAGDVNGDGFTDVLLASSPSIAVFQGGTGGAAYERPRQLRADASAPIAPLGITSGDSAAFRIRGAGSTPAGRGDVQFEWEVKPFGAPFDGVGVGRSAAVDTGPPAPGTGSRHEGFEALVQGLPPGIFKWRARVVTHDPIFPHSPWFGISGNSLSEADFRTAVCGAPPGEVRGLVIAANKTSLSWSVSLPATGYDVLRGDIASLPVGPGGDDEACLARVLSPSSSDISSPSGGNGLWYLVRAVNTCGAGSYGSTSEGSPETTVTCP